METFNTTDLQHLADCIEASLGCLPPICRVETLYQSYRRWVQERGIPMTDDLEFFVRTLAEQGYAPCRMPDGTLGFIGLTPRPETLPGARA